MDRFISEAKTLSYFVHLKFFFLQTYFRNTFHVQQTIIYVSDSGAEAESDKHFTNNLYLGFVYTVTI